MSIGKTQNKNIIQMNNKNYNIMTKNMSDIIDCAICVIAIRNISNSRRLIVPFLLARPCV